MGIRGLIIGLPRIIGCRIRMPGGGGPVRKQMGQLRTSTEQFLFLTYGGRVLCSLQTPDPNTQLEFLVHKS